jgi:hypothetical protein
MPQEKKRKTLNASHQNLLIPGILSPSSPPECRFLLTAFKGELFTNVGPLETGLGRPGVEVLFDLYTSAKI